MRIQDTCRTLIDLFEQSLARTRLAQKNYLEIIRKERQEVLTFGQLKTKAREFAFYLIQNKDIRIRDKIAVLGKNRADWDIAFWGVILAGAVPVLIDPQRRIEGVKKHLIHTDTRLLILADDYQDENSRTQLKEFLSREGIGFVEMTVYEKADSEDVRFAILSAKIRSQVKADDTAVILCTSGTTGEPQEVEITHSNLIANIQGALDVVTITEADKLGHIMPPHHAFGLTVGKLLPLCVGATNLYTNKYHQISNLIRDKRITIFVAVPAVFDMFAKKIEDRLKRQKEKNRLIGLADRYCPGLVGRMIVKKMGWEKLRFFVSGAAAVPKWVLNVFWRRDLQLWEGYGTTESSPVYGFNNERRKLGSVGRPIPTLSVKIVSEKGNILTPGREGEIVLGGPCIVKGYYKNSQATDAVIKMDENGVRWLYTGDLGYLDKDGYLFITGRKKYLIVLPSGKNVNPELVEQALSKAQYVDELIVVPSYRKDSAGVEQEAVGVIVRPNWKKIRADTKLCRRDLVNQPAVLKDLLWQSINKCQQENQDLADFEKVPSKHLLEIEINEFHKTSTGKIKRNSYVKAR
jgi:long-chain acyl-CoA synthetase